MKFLNFVLCLMVFTMPVCGQEVPRDNQVLPVDEGAQDPDFFVFRRDLINAVVHHDVDFIKSIVHPKIGFSFGDDEETAENFFKWVKIDDPKTTFYDDLLSVLLNGGEWKEYPTETDGVTVKVFTAPYTFNTDKITDAYEELVVIDHDVPVYESPSAEAKILERISYSILKRNYKGEDKEEWPGVFTTKGVPGFVSSSQVRSAVDYRASFSKDAKGQYKMDMFIAGD